MTIETCPKRHPDTPVRLLSRLGALTLLLPMLLALWPGSAVARQQSPEIQLAEKYAPIVYIQDQPSTCAVTGEPYLPAPVDAVLDNPDVQLRQIAPDGGSDDPVVMTGPTAQDLAGLDDTYYLDFPGEPRSPECEYETWFRETVAARGIEPTIYARIATQDDRPGELALQYWHYWVFNDFNNKHESDWEMVQLTFDADSAEEALTKEPASLAFAQHGGGERADWDDEKVQREGDRLRIYPAAGSHASYFNHALWIGWGSHGSGFGCDDIRRPIDRVEPRVVLIPDTIDPNGEFAWMLFEGRWGQRESWEFNGPRGLNQGSKWTEPIGWTDDIRQGSLAVPGLSDVGPGPAAFFCSLSGAASAIVTVFPLAPEVASAITLAMVGVLVVVLFLARRYLIRGAVLYARHWILFLGISGLLLLVAAIGNGIDNGLRQLAPDDLRPNSGGFSPILDTTFGIGIQSFQQLLTFALMVPVIAFTTKEIQEGDHVTARAAARFVLGRFWTALGAVALPLLITGLLSATVILLPVAIYKAVQWLYAPHAVVIDGAGWREARHVSRRAVKGHWWRTLGIGSAIAIFSGVPGPLVSVIGLVLLGFSMGVADIVSTLIYIIVYPIAVIASTLYYLHIRAEDHPVEVEEPVPGDPAGPEPAGVPT